MLLNLNHKTLTAEKLILEKKNLQPEKKKQLLIMQETYMYCDIRYEHSWTLFCTVKRFETVVGTLIQYFLDGNTLIIRIQCCVLEVLVAYK